MFYCYHCVDTSAGGLLLTEDIIPPVVNASALTLFITYIYYENLQFLNNVIITKTKVLTPRAYVTFVDFGCPLVIVVPEDSNILKLFGFPIFCFERI